MSLTACTWVGIDAGVHDNREGRNRWPARGATWGEVWGRGPGRDGREGSGHLGKETGGGGQGGMDLIVVIISLIVVINPWGNLIVVIISDQLLRTILLLVI